MKQKPGPWEGEIQGKGLDEECREEPQVLWKMLGQLANLCFNKLLGAFISHLFLRPDRAVLTHGYKHRYLQGL